MTLHSLQFLNKNRENHENSREVGVRAGKAMTHTLWNGISREEGGLRQKCSPWGVWIFSEITQFQQYSRESNPGGRLVCKFSISSSEQNYPWENAPLTLLPRAARVCLSRYSPYREFALRLWWDGPVRMFCNKGISVSRISKSIICITNTCDVTW